MSGGTDFTAPDCFAVGAEGEPGQRLFLIQVREGTRRLTLKVEKQQVAVLAEYLGGIVRNAPRPDHLPEGVAVEPVPEPDWVAGTIGVSYDEDEDRVVVVVEEAVPDDETGAIARIAVTREQAGAFAIAATRLVEAGRPPCPLCAGPLDPSGHVCPRTNGHRPPAP